MDVDICFQRSDFTFLQYDKKLLQLIRVIRAGDST